MSGPSQAVFLSYASQDAAAAQRLCDALRAAGVEVWFDRNELGGGDAWDAKIRRQIAECGLFVPVISAATQARLEGYFRIEWKLAAQRTHAMADEKAFLLPVVIDDTRDAEARVPAEFKVVQWTRLRQGFGEAGAPMQAETEKFCARVRALLDGSALEPGRPRPGERGEGAASLPDAKARRRVPAAPWIAAATAAAAVLLFAIIVRRAWQIAPRAPVAAAAAHSQPVAPPTKVQQLVAQARALFEPWDFATVDDFKHAERLLKEATDLEPSNADAWAALAIQAVGQHLFGFDRTDAREGLLRTAAERAAKLAPTSDYAQLALALRYRIAPGTEQDALRILRDLEPRHGSDKFVLRQLGGVLLALNRDEEALAVFARAAALPGGDAIALLQQARIFQRRRLTHEMVAALDRALALRPDYGAAHIQKIFAELFARGDIDGTKRALQQVPVRVMSDERVASVAAFTWYCTREADKATEALRHVSRDYVESNVISMPKSLLAGLIHRLAGRNDAAAIEWRRALRVVEARVAANTAAAGDVAEKALLHALLGEHAAAEESLRIHEQLARTPPGRASRTTWLVHAELGRADEVADFFAEQLKSPGTAPVYAAWFRIHPSLDRFRGLPRFRALAAETDRVFAPVAAGAPKPADPR